MDSLILVQNIKTHCTAKGVKPTTACKESGVGGSFINDIERGRSPSVAKVQLLAAYLGVTTSDLLGEKKEPGATNGTELVLTQEEARFIGYLRQMTPDQRKALNEKMEFLISMQVSPPAGRE